MSISHRRGRGWALALIVWVAGIGGAHVLGARDAGPRIIAETPRTQRSQSQLVGLFSAFPAALRLRDDPRGLQPSADTRESACMATGTVVAAVDDEAACAPASDVAAIAGESAARLGYCKCGCGARCQTSADCGGAACVPFVTCCTIEDPDGDM